METPLKKLDLLKVAEVELIYKSKVKASQRIKADSPKAVVAIFKEYWDQDRIELVEEFKVLFVNNALKAIGIFDHSKGGTQGTTVDVRVILAAALKANATSIFLAHNHPSGELKPSQADLAITRKISEAGSILNIKLLDHFIITKEDYQSITDYELLGRNK